MVVVGVVVVGGWRGGGRRGGLLLLLLPLVPAGGGGDDDGLVFDGAPSCLKRCARTHARSLGTDRTNKGAWEPKNHEGAGRAPGLLLCYSIYIGILGSDTETCLIPKKCHKKKNWWLL